MKDLKILSVVLALCLVFLAGCETAQQSGPPLSKSTQTRIAFNTTDTLYTGGLGEAGLEGFCRRIRSYLVKDLADRGITAAPESDGGAGYAQITIRLSSVESKAGESMGVFMSFASYKPHVKYSATLESPSGSTVASWNHEVDEDTVDKLSEHVAADVAKYLSRGFR